MATKKSLAPLDIHCPACRAAPGVDCEDDQGYLMSLSHHRRYYEAQLLEEVLVEIAEAGVDGLFLPMGGETRRATTHLSRLGMAEKGPDARWRTTEWAKSAY